MNQLLSFLALSENGHTGNPSAHHGDFVAAMQTRATLAIFEDLVGQVRFVFDYTETVLEKEIGNACEEADRLNTVLFGFFNERAKNTPTSSLPLGTRRNYDGADFAEMWPVKMKCATAKEYATIRLGDGEVADIFANL